MPGHCRPEMRLRTRGRENVLNAMSGIHQTRDRTFPRWRFQIEWKAIASVFDGCIQSPGASNEELFREIHQSCGPGAEPDKPLVGKSGLHIRVALRSSATQNLAAIAGDRMNPTQHRAVAAN